MQAGSPADRAAEQPSAAPPPLDFAGNPDAVSVVAEAVRLAHGHQFNPAFATEISRIDTLPHQRIAVYERMLRQQPLRFLLADDAGAGKTIMTGLYVREMLSRGRIRRVLIVPPAGLVGNWERELRTLFRLRFRIATGADARAGNPFRGADSDLVIVSLDTLAGERTFGSLREAGVPPYDLVVFDEAHKLSVVTEQHGVRKRRRYQLAEALAGGAGSESQFAGLGWSARHLLLLTATPHMGKDEPYHHLWRLLDQHVFATGEALRRMPRQDRDRYFIRRTKEEMVGLDGAPLYRRRACDTFSFDLSPGPDGEQALYDETTAYLRHTYDRALGNRPAVRLAMGVFQRRLASSTLAVLRSFERRMAKLERTAGELQSGQVSAADLYRRQRGLDRDHGDDFFDTHGADDDASDDSAGERHEEYEDTVLGALVAVTIDELKREIETLAGLRARARRLFESGHESKFEKLREVLEDPLHAGEKWLVFTEHRDTADYLVRRLEGLGFSGQVGQIHGGLQWPAREEQVERFRRPDGARFLVATDAAGEGINLQFCRLMVNYDIPWNPARLEQRMGRIHRYGQRRDVRIVNLIAGSTHEGRVLQVLLEKLDAIRKQLRSDKVFDVIGRLFENASLREYMAEALTDDGERQVVGRVTRALAGDPVGAVRTAEARIYGAPGDVSGRLGALRQDMERERYLQLLPGYVRRFVEKSAALLDMEIRATLTATSRSHLARPARSTSCCRRSNAIRPRRANACASGGPWRMRPASGSTPASRCSTRWPRRSCAGSRATRCGAASSPTRRRTSRTSSNWRWPPWNRRRLTKRAHARSWNGACSDCGRARTARQTSIPWSTCSCCTALPAWRPARSRLPVRGSACGRPRRRTPAATLPRQMAEAQQAALRAGLPERRRRTRRRLRSPRRRPGGPPRDAVARRGRLRGS